MLNYYTRGSREKFFVYISAQCGHGTKTFVHTVEYYERDMNQSTEIPYRRTSSIQFVLLDQQYKQC